jgi:hypothetical protein
MIVFEFDDDNRMTGIEVIGASKALPRALLERLTTA